MNIYVRIFGLIFQLSLYSILNNYINKTCECLDKNIINYLKYITNTILLLSIVGFILPQYYSIIGIIWFLLIISLIIVWRKHVNKIEKDKCDCAKEKYFSVINIIVWIYIILFIIYFLQIIFLLGFTYSLHTTTNDFDKLDKITEKFLDKIDFKIYTKIKK